MGTTPALASTVVSAAVTSPTVAGGGTGGAGVEGPGDGPGTVGELLQPASTTRGTIRRIVFINAAPFDE
jgi:hypothetical protein